MVFSLAFRPVRCVRARADATIGHRETKTRRRRQAGGDGSKGNNVALVNERARILANGEVGPNLYLMELASPHIAAAIEPGQFVHMKVPNMEAHILRRPFSVYARDAAAGTLEILYQAVGFGSFLEFLVVVVSVVGYAFDPVGEVV